MDTSGSIPSRRASFVPALPMTPPLISLSSSEISSDTMPEVFGWTTTCATPEDARAITVTGTWPWATSGYGLGLVHQLSRGMYTRGVAGRSTGKCRGNRLMPMANKDYYGSAARASSDSTCPRTLLSRRREKIRRRKEILRQHIESEQRRPDDRREGFARLKDVLPVSLKKDSKMALLN
ncbi:hypothetical protein FRC07_008696 [Ceratobasidium sp. 392]|nr:hypothetical protein FRC07_008696 [Ceratobasidium sp. 392]